MRAAVYLRISDDRVGAGLGVERQRQDCEQLAARLPADVVKVYVDNDESAFDRRRKRPAYERLVEDVRNGRFDVVLAWHTDRLHRTPRELEDWIDACERHGVSVHTVKAGPIDLATPSGRMVARQLGAVARYESEHKRDRNLRKAQELADAGKVGNGGPRPFGYTASRLELQEDEAEVLRELYADVLAGRGVRTLCRDLDERGIRTTTGGAWSQQGLRYNLLSPRNAGLREHRGAVVGPAVWPAVVDRETWEQARAVLTSSRRIGDALPYARRYLLTGFLRCGLCGGKLKPNRSAELQRFGCRPEPGDGRCGRILIRYSPVEEFVEDLVLARLETQAELQPEDPADPSDALRAQITTFEQRLQGLAEEYADGDRSALELRASGQVLRERIAGLRRQIVGVAQARRMAEPLVVRDAWPTYDLEQRRAALDVMLERIDVAPAKRGLNRFDPDRLTVLWR